MKPLHKIAFLLILALFGGLTLLGQQGAPEFDFCKSSNQITNNGMVFLGSWALGNIAIGAYGWNKKSGQTMYFHQMNVFWNLVNFSIAGVSLMNNLPIQSNTLAIQEVYSSHLKTEKILLINAVLDVGYISTGYLLNHLSKKSARRADLLKGYGNSLYLQGGFLFVFDSVMYLLMRSERLQFLECSGFQLTGGNLGLKLSYIF